MDMDPVPQWRDKQTDLGQGYVMKYVLVFPDALGIGVRDRNPTE